MFDTLESIPAYPDKMEARITKETYDRAVDAFTKHLERAFERFEAYWKTGNEVLFELSLEELLQAHNFMSVIMDAVANDKVMDKMSHRATFIYDLAACMLGVKNA